MRDKTQVDEHSALAGPPANERLARRLISDELFDLSLYKRLRLAGSSALKETLDELIVVEAEHFAFWQDFFKIEIPTLDLRRRAKLSLIVLICRIFGDAAIDLVLEAIEVYGIRKYLSVWDLYKDQALGAALQGILQDEFKHEDTVVTRLQERIINPDRVRNIFLGLNDGMVEILGAVSGFFASLGQTALVLIAGLTTAAAGALSMAAGAYIAASSENEVRRTQDDKSRFLGEKTGLAESGESAVTSAIIVGVSYFVGAAFPILPVLFGAKSALASIITGGSMILIVSGTLAFLTGMDIRKRALTNLVLIALAVGVTYAIGLLVRSIVGIHI